MIAPKGPLTRQRWLAAEPTWVRSTSPRPHSFLQRTGSAPYNNLLAFHLYFADNYTIGTDYSSLQHGGPFKIGAALAE